MNGEASLSPELQAIFLSMKCQGLFVCFDRYLELLNEQPESFIIMRQLGE